MNQANIPAEGCPVTEAELEAIARYSRRRLTAEEVYTFPLVLCDNDLDRDHECFTDAALEKLAGLFQKSGDGWLEVDFSPWGSGPAEKRVFATLKTAILSRREIAFDYYSARGEKSRRAEMRKDFA